MSKMVTEVNCQTEWDDPGEAFSASASAERSAHVPRTREHRSRLQNAQVSGLVCSQTVLLIYHSLKHSATDLSLSRPTTILLGSAA